MAATLSPYEYGRLEANEIRLLVLKVARDLSAPLQCTLRKATLPRATSVGCSRGAQAYQALSYAWGDDTLNHTIICDGCYLRIARRLHVALLRIREEYAANLGRGTGPEKMPLWVDSLCINQTDKKEKSQQVQIMSRIYTAAKRLIIWLGDPVLENENNMNGSSADFPAWSECDERSIMKWFDRDEDSARTLRASSESKFRLLLQASWFGRRWCVQELLAAAEHDRWILFGSHSIPYEEFKHNIERLGLLDSAGPLKHSAWHPIALVAQLSDDLGENWAIKPKMLPRRYKTHVPLRHGSRTTGGNDDFEFVFGPHRSLLENLHIFNDFKCSDPLDTIYALYSISNDRYFTSSNMVVDYRKGVDQLFGEVAMLYLNPEFLLPLLACASCRTDWRTRADGSAPPPFRMLPSWIPDWRNTVSYVSRLHQRVLEELHFCKPLRTCCQYGGDLDQPCILRVEADPKLSSDGVLSLTGFLILCCSKTSGCSNGDCCDRDKIRNYEKEQRQLMPEVRPWHKSIHNDIDSDEFWTPQLRPHEALLFLPHSYLGFVLQTQNHEIATRDQVYTLQSCFETSLTPPDTYLMEGHHYCQGYEDYRSRYRFFGYLQKTGVSVSNMLQNGLFGWPVIYPLEALPRALKLTEILPDLELVTVRLR